MKNIPEISMDAFRYHLPPERIAQHPLSQRDASKLLVFEGDVCQEDQFINLPKYLSDKDLLVFNNTKVIQARLVFEKPTGARMEIFLLEPIAPSNDFSIVLQETQKVTWRCLLGNARRWSDESYTIPIDLDGKTLSLMASGKIPLKEGTFSITFTWNDPNYTFGQVIESGGNTPLPPYIKRESIPEDRIRYQTVMAEFDGSVAAPTAGLHFSNEVLTQLSEKGIGFQSVTLQVGLGTFRPIASKRANDHMMHQESFSVTEETLNALIQHFPERIIAIGTTSVRTLESLYWLGVRTIETGIPPTMPLEQWFPYQEFADTDIDMPEALNALIGFINKQKLEQLSSETQLMIVPGYQFRTIRGMVTNFHQPGSSLLLLVAAFLGNDWTTVYDYALTHDFRFLSYGDACLFL
jgi:S-adenosylmethionine:tRNA ribosyltransferase-isomerase